MVPRIKAFFQLVLYKMIDAIDNAEIPDESVEEASRQLVDAEY